LTWEVDEFQTRRIEGLFTAEVDYLMNQLFPKFRLPSPKSSKAMSRPTKNTRTKIGG
jgi:hypothetical protein